MPANQRETPKISTTGGVPVMEGVSESAETLGSMAAKSAEAERLRADPLEKGPGRYRDSPRLETEGRTSAFVSVPRSTFVPDRQLCWSLDPPPDVTALIHTEIASKTHEADVCVQPSLSTQSLGGQSVPVVTLYPAGLGTVLVNFV